jgi:hypothetical protein
VRGVVVLDRRSGRRSGRCVLGRARGRRRSGARGIAGRRRGAVGCTCARRLERRGVERRRPAADVRRHHQPVELAVLRATELRGRGHPRRRDLWSGAFDGRYVYYTPYSFEDGTFTGLAVRYDTQANFISTAAWSSFDLATINPGAVGYAGAEFDGRYVYFVPLSRGPASSAPYNGLVVRYDTTASFGDVGSFDVFDTTSVAVDADGFAGGAFDGTHVYFAPYITQGGNGHIAVRFDSTAGFETSSAWSVFDVSSVNAKAVGFIGGVFDGRYLYLVPTGGGTSMAPAVRYDTTAAFDATASWSTFGTSYFSNVAGFQGGAFDGQYVYFMPGNGLTPAVRFDAKTPPSLPPSYHGSFF